MEVSRNNSPFKYQQGSWLEYSHAKDELECSKTHEIHLHEHSTYEIYYLISGKVTYYIEGTVYHLLPGDLLAISDKELHRATVESFTAYERISVFINKQMIKELSSAETNLLEIFTRSKSAEQNALVRPNEKYSKSIDNLFTQLERTMKNEMYGTDLLISAYLTELLVLLNTIQRAPHELSGVILESDSIFNKILYYINEDLSRDIKLYEVAEKFYISQYYLTRKFKEFTGFTFHQYVQNKRLMMAQQMLLKGYSTREIIIKCGFNGYSSFVRAFTSKFGVSPQRYLKNKSLEFHPLYEEIDESDSEPEKEKNQL